MSSIKMKIYYATHTGGYLPDIIKECRAYSSSKYKFDKILLSVMDMATRRPDAQFIHSNFLILAAAVEPQYILCVYALRVSPATYEYVARVIDARIEHRLWCDAIKYSPRGVQYLIGFPKQIVIEPMLPTANIQSLHILKKNNMFKYDFDIIMDMLDCCSISVSRIGDLIDENLIEFPKHHKKYMKEIILNGNNKYDPAYLKRWFGIEIKFDGVALEKFLNFAETLIDEETTYAFEKYLSKYI